MNTSKQIKVKQQKFEQIFHRDSKYCDCAMPMVSKKWNDAMGTFVCIRLCCMAKALEQLTGMSLYEVFHFQPKWQWDCEEMIEKTDVTGTIQLVKRGPPPSWMAKRMKDKGIHIKGLPGGSS